MKQQQDTNGYYIYNKNISKLLTVFAQSDVFALAAVLVIDWVSNVIKNTVENKHHALMLNHRVLIMRRRSILEAEIFNQHSGKRVLAAGRSLQFNKFH